MSKFFIFGLIMTTAFGSIYDFKIESTNLGTIDLNKHKNKNILITNIATKCGYTPQLDFLEKISKEKKSQLLVIGIPSNDFGAQTPEDDKGVAEFCRVKYGVSFPLTKKLIVKGNDKNKLISYLQTKSKSGEIKWNFEKYLVLPKESKVIHFNSNQTKEIIDSFGTSVF